MVLLLPEAPVPLSCPLRVYISVAPQLTPTYPLEPIYPLSSTWASFQVPPPVTLHCDEIEVGFHRADAVAQIPRGGRRGPMNLVRDEIEVRIHRVDAATQIPRGS